ncbi:hypothetical protein P153DRAFT_409533 [Dothidotthia symphoricarpi CBS 119687]|uniref:SWIM-type domain-containing protein n=1 Tax=Dothidotthia symphoricarpi CBS 119687 TaxID=1392245 RepID=A0A6A6AQB5_9PLEO|nr:uncharacterized protein P153DRAFT_409533 [Dothidotthia symphoricarpi CBS 119687]KAF2134119.1 hypothetical protein P153DRAFT_409533 [Dothidotthia symphoricarpi CBS 119687]
MSDAFSRFALVEVTGQSTPEQDYLRRFPTEIRLMIFQELLSVWPKTVFRGANTFGPLDPNEFQREIPIPWQILATCHKYHDEALPIMYGKNKFVFCTGENGSPGMFWRFPIKMQYMHLITDLGIYMRCDTPTKEAANRVAHFIKAIARRAVKLQNLVVLVSSDRSYGAKCPWDIMFNDHPVAKALVKLVESQTVKHFKLRMHDAACVAPDFASYLCQTFYELKPATDRSITFSRSCSCPRQIATSRDGYCRHCLWPREYRAYKAIDRTMYPAELESDQERMMDLQEDLFQLGLLPPTDDLEEEDPEKASTGPYIDGRVVEDTYEEDRLGFSLGLLLPGQVRHFRSNIAWPAVWWYRQTELTEFYEYIDKDDYLVKALVSK